MKVIYLLRICKIDGAKVLESSNYAFETEEQVDRVVELISKNPNANVGKNPGTMLFKEALNFFAKDESMNVNVSEKKTTGMFDNLSKGKSLPWEYQRPFR